ncbi:sugar transferase [bacterium]|nr:sugar transferase [bacterium]
MRNIFQYILDYIHWLFILIADVSMIMFTFWCGYQFWLISPNRIHPNPPAFQTMDVIGFTIIIVIALILGGTYKPQSSVFHVVRLKNLVKYTGIGFIVALMISFFSKSLLISRLQSFYTMVLIFPMIILERSIIDGLWNKFVTQKFQLKRVVIFGAGDTGKRLVKAIEKHPKLGYKVVAFFDDMKSNDTVIMAKPVPVLGGREKFRKYLGRVKRIIDGVMIAMPAATSEQTRQIMKICEEKEVSYRFVPSLNELTLHRVRQEQLDGVPLFGLKELELSLASRFFKRVFDIVATVIILVLTSPVFGIIALCIKLDSKGKVIFSQKRIGLRGSEFTLYKFRTMYTETPEYAVHPQDRNDPRITRVGRYLRRTSFDELPQFWNVLKGDMSIVGPRPEMPFIVEQYNDIHCERLNVKPGITGLWQVSADRSLPIHENIDHDLYYIENQSLLLDIIIILQTVWFALIRGVGAK